MYLGSEPLLVGGHDIAVTIDDFWRWSFSDFTDYATRSAFSRFLVASSLSLTTDSGVSPNRTRDLLWSPAGDIGIRISVRTAAFVQSGEAEYPDHIVFTIPNRPTCNAYVFCVFKAMTQEESPLNTDLWDFYALRPLSFGRSMPEQGFITLPALMSHKPVWSDYYGIGGAVQRAVTAV